MKRGTSMKKELLVLGTCLLLAGCSSGVSQEEYESVSSAASLAESEKESLSAIIKSISSEYANYKESMSPYESLSEAEANAKKIEAESIAAQASIAAESSKAAEVEAANASKAAEEAAKAAEEAKGYETGITYDQLARTPDDYTGQKIKFSGKVIQVMEGDGSVQIRFAVNDDYDNVLLGQYVSSVVSSRILEDDKITIYGTSAGLISYQSTMGGNITIPSIIIEKIDQ